MYGIYTRPHNQTLVFVRHAKWLPTTSATISVQWVTATIAGPGCSGVIQVLGFSPQRQSFFFFLAPEGVFLEILHIPQFLAESWRIPHEAAEEGGICITDHETQAVRIDVVLVITLKVPHAEVTARGLLYQYFIGFPVLRKVYDNVFALGENVCISFKLKWTPSGVYHVVTSVTHLCGTPTN